MQKERELQLNLADVHLGFGEPLLIPQNVQYEQGKFLQTKRKQRKNS